MKRGTIRREWAARVQQWSSSDKSAKAWCQENNLVYTTFLGWVHRAKDSKVQSSLFVELKDQPQSSSGITLEYDDVRINVLPNFDPITLNRCLQVLRGKKC
jgi:hypothetical protein